MLAVQSDQYSDSYDAPITATLRITLQDYPNVTKDYSITVDLFCDIDHLMWDSNIDTLTYIIGVDP